MKKEELELLDKQIELMLSIQFMGMSKTQQKYLVNSMAGIRLQYEEAAKKRDADDADAATKEKYAGICNSIAGGLPDITKGALTAANAFRRGDSINGTAAIMDICAAVAPIIGSLFTAGGPPGALFGSLFSVVGQLLSFFGPQQPSLKEEIEKMLLDHEADTELKEVKAVANSIDFYARTLIDASTDLPTILEMPLTTPREANAFIQAILGLNIGLTDNKESFHTPAFAAWGVLEWLKMEKRQDLDKWPQVLSVFCQAYAKLVGANVLFNCWPDRVKIDALLDENAETNESCPLPQLTRSSVRSMLNELQGRANAYRKDWQNYNRTVLALMRSIEQPARDRGLFLHIGGGYLYGASGKGDLFDKHDWHYLRCDSDNKTSGQGFISAVTATQPWGDAGTPTSPYHCFLLRPLTYSDGYRDDSIEYRTINSSNPPTNVQPTTGTFAKGGGSIRIKKIRYLQSNPVVTDLHAIPGGWEDKPNEVWLYLATGTRIVELELNEDRDLENRGWQSRDAKSQVVRVRSVYPESAQDDPEGTIDTVFRSVQHPVETLIHYGGMANSSDIFVVKHNEDVQEYVSTPWSQYLGIGVDERYLWVFGTGGFACATHTSVIKAVNERAEGKNQGKPRWMAHYPNKVLYKGLPGVGEGLVGPRPGEPELQGLRDLAPCEDGTLVANMSSRSYDRSGKFQGEDGPSMYTTGYQVDVVAGTIGVGNWARLDGSAQQVHKQPIYCWPIFDGLRARLTAQSNQG